MRPAVPASSIPVLLVAVGSLAAALVPLRATGQATLRERIAELSATEMDFAPVYPRSESVAGVPVYFLEDRELPLITLYASFRGGANNFGREHYAALAALPGLLRKGGTATLPADSVDIVVESMALAMSFGRGGRSASASVNFLSDQLDAAVELWGEMLREPRFDSVQVAEWREGELERMRRRREDLGVVAIGTFNRIIYGDHPIGWELTPDDLAPEHLANDRLRHVHAALICPENLTLGVVGDIGWERASEVLEGLLAEWAPCSGELLEAPTPTLRHDPGVFVIHREVAQSVVVLGHSSRVRLGKTREYFASRIGNAILGASGLSSRLNTEIRTREGLAYDATSIWNAPADSDGLLGGLTRTKPETTLRAARLMLEGLASMSAEAPADHEVERATREIVNGFVFNFAAPARIVTRAIAYETMGLSGDWLRLFVRGVQDVTPGDVLEVFHSQVDTARMTYLLLGDTTRFDGSPSELGAVTVIEPPPW
ncbi:MAG: insulinase family protein [Gemmatimonadetes bacterium]|nr:insulinase family protein [Gemmatimonadota bacterium]MCY3942184.1 insulinase family protein [Gemmatimonadota bacterium]